MANLTREQKRVVLLLLVERYFFDTVNFDTNQGESVVQAIDKWFRSNRRALNKVIENSAPKLLSQRAKDALFQAYMHFKSIGPPKQRLVIDYYDDALEVRRELEQQSDRGAGIVGAAFLETRLEKALRSYVVHTLSENEANELFRGPTAPVGTFSGKIRLAHALGLVGDDSYSDLHTIRRIRNDFAHSLKINSFHKPPVSDRCSQLRFTSGAFSGLHPQKGPREAFISSVVNIMHFVYSEIIKGSGPGEPATMSP